MEPFGPTKSVQQDKTAWLIEFFDLRDTVSAAKGLHQLILSDRSQLDVGLYVKDGHANLPGLFETTATSSASQQQDSLLLQSFDRLLSDAHPYQPQTHSPFFEAPRHGSLGRSNSFTRHPANPGEEGQALAPPGLWSPTQDFGGRLTPLPLLPPGSYMATTPLSTPPRSYSLKHDKILYNPEEEEILSLGERMGSGPPPTPPKGLRSPDYFSWPSLPRSASSANQIPIYPNERDSATEQQSIGNTAHSLGRPLSSPRSVSSSPMIQPHRLDHRSVSSSSFDTTNNNNGNNHPDYQAIESGRDQRTTFMIRNIPNKYSQQMLIEFLNETHHVSFRICAC